MQGTVDYTDFQDNQQSKQDESLLVKFFIKQREDRDKSEIEGRPIYKDVEYVDIKVAGSRDGGVTRPATARDKERFPRHYAAFKQRVEVPEEGTPLAEWPVMTRSQVEELSFYNVKTVEQLISMSDQIAGKFMGINGLKQKAKKFLENADATARINEIESLKNDNEAKTQRIDDLEQMLIKMNDRLHELESAEPAVETTKPRGRPAKK